MKNKKELLREIEKYAGKLYGFEIIIAKNPKNKEYIKGFLAGKKFMKKEIIRLLKDEK